MRATKVKLTVEIDFSGPRPVDSIVGAVQEGLMWLAEHDSLIRDSDIPDGEQDEGYTERVVAILDDLWE